MLIVPVGKKMYGPAPSRPQRKFASKGSDMLSSAIQQAVGNANDMVPIREALGEILSEVNAVADVLRISRMSPQTVREKAQAILPDVAGLSNIQAMMPQVAKICEYWMESGKQGGEGEGVTRSESGWARNQGRVIEYMIRTISSARIPDEQVEALKNLAAGTAQPQQLSEVDFDRMQNFLQHAVYSTANESEKTLRVVREILQNANDATMRRKREEPEHKPRIDVYLSAPKRTEYVDLVVVDNGVGMDWETLSKSFFVYLSKGKKGPEDVGGYGIAKAIIQETPKHGWAVETNGLHTDRFGRSMYFATQGQHQATPVKMDIRGTTLALYGLPFVHDYEVKSLCSTYSLGQVEIAFNDTVVEPRFRLEDIKPLDDKLTGVASLVSSTEDEKEAAEAILKSHSITFQLGEMASGRTSITFGMKRMGKDSSYGRLFFILNGQYQFDKFEGIEKVDIICLATTTARPGDEDYPIDPGRENLREPFASHVSRQIDNLKQILEKISRNLVFEKGLIINIYNQDFAPIDTAKETEQEPTELRKSIEDAFSAPGQPKFTAMFRENPEQAAQNVQQAFQANPQQAAAAMAQMIQSNPQQAAQTLVEVYKQNPQEALQQIAQAAQKIGEEDQEQKPAPAPPQPADQQKPPEQAEAERKREEEEQRLKEEEQRKQNNLQRQMAMASIAVLQEMEPADAVKEIPHIIENLGTPCAVMTEQGFVAQEILDDNPELISRLAIVWSLILRRTIKQAGKLYYERSPKQVIPGIIVSKEACAIYMPPRPEEGTKYTIIGVNPITVATLLDPEAVSGKTPLSVKPEVSEHESPGDVTLVDKLASYLHHEAIHEVTHLLFRDSYMSDAFHMYVTKVESLCHFIYKDNKHDVSMYFKGMKTDIRELMALIRAVNIPKDIAGGRISSQVVAQSEMKKMYDAFKGGKSYREIEAMFNLSPANGNHAYRVIQRYMKLMGQKGALPPAAQVGTVASSGRKSTCSSWMLVNCRFAQASFHDVVEQAWEYLAQEEQYQLDRLEVHGTPMDTWLRNDQQVLEDAEKSGDVVTVQKILEKYKKIDEAARATPSA
jgi:hypothetical protein